jgi:hypothetical protein
MKVSLQSVLGNTSYQAAANVYALFYMPGTAPQTPAQLKAAVDLSDTSDLLSKSVGIGLVSATIALDTTGACRYSMTFNNLGVNTSYLKGGSVQSGSYFIPMPSRAYYTNGRKSDLWSFPPNLIAMSYGCIKNTVSNMARYKYRDSALAYGVKAAGSEIMFNVEYDVATTISAMRIVSGGAVVNNDYVYQVKVEYWNGSSWQVAYGGVDVIGSGVMKDVTFSAVTATKYKVTLYPYSETAGQYSMLSGGIALMHTSATAQTPVPDITWGVLIPYPDADSLVSSVYNNANFVTNDPYAIDPMNNPLVVRSAPYYGKVTTNFPAIIDSCGQDSVTNKMAISKSIGLTSDDHPLLAAYKYYPGDLS